MWRHEVKQTLRRFQQHSDSTRWNSGCSKQPNSRQGTKISNDLVVVGELWWSWFDASSQPSAIGDIWTNKEINSKSRDFYKVLKPSLQMSHFSSWSCSAPSVGDDSDGKRQRCKEALTSVQHCSALHYPHAISNASEANSPFEGVGRIFFLPFFNLNLLWRQKSSLLEEGREREKWKHTFWKSFTTFMNFF